MAEDTGNETTTVSRASHDRVKGQLEAAQKALADKEALNTQANGALRDLNLRLKAAEALESAGIPDAIKRSAYTVPHLAGIDGDEDFTARMETIIGDLGWTPAADPSTNGDQPLEEKAPDPKTTPVPAMAGPNPAAPGAAPAAKQAVNFVTWLANWNQENPGRTPTEADFTQAIADGTLVPQGRMGQNLVPSQ